MKKIGIFGGTFDPIHFGHLNLALSILEKHKLEEIWWIPVKINPLKLKHPTADFHRLAMLKLALEHLPFFKILELELRHNDTSYTIETIKILRAQFPSYRFYLLLGDDALLHFMNWKSPLEIIQLAPPLIGSRKYEKCPDLSLPHELQKIFQRGWTRIPLLEISSTELRKRVKNNLYCEHLAPAKTLDYIREYQLYS